MNQNERQQLRGLHLRVDNRDSGDHNDVAGARRQSLHSPKEHVPTLRVNDLHQTNSQNSANVIHGKDLDETN